VPCAGVVTKAVGALQTLILWEAAKEAAIGAGAAEVVADAISQGRVQEDGKAAAADVILDLKRVRT
jgi:hypothetical protein